MMIKSAQRKMLRLIVQTKRKYKQKAQKEKSKDEGTKTDAGSSDWKIDHREYGEEIEEGETSNTDCDQDSDVSFMKDSEEDIEEIENEEEE